MELRVTINGNERLPVDVEEFLAAALNNPNAEFAVTIVCSPYDPGTPGSPKKAELDNNIRKLKAIFVESIKIRT